MSDRLTELIDAAQNQQRENEERALKNVRARMAPESHPHFDGSHCVEADCEALLPKARLLDGRIRCVECQTRIEQERHKRR